MARAVSSAAKAFGARVLQRRRDLSLSQRDLAGRVGITQAAVSLIERGESGVSHDVVRGLAKALEISPQALTGSPLPDVSEVADVKANLSSIKERHAREMEEAVASARSVDMDWSTIARRLGVSRDTLRRRYPDIS